MRVHAGWHNLQQAPVFIPTIPAATDVEQMPALNPVVDDNRPLAEQS
jgi:hypothetical protein